MTENFIYFYSEIFNIVVVNVIKILLICFFLSCNNIFTYKLLGFVIELSLNIKNESHSIKATYLN